MTAFAHTFRVTVQNLTGVQINSVSAVMRPWKLDSSGALVYGAAQTIIASGNIASAASASSGWIDNSLGANGWMGAHFTVPYQPSAAPGTNPLVNVFLEYSLDAGSSSAATPVENARRIGRDVPVGTAARRIQFEV